MEMKDRWEPVEETRADRAAGWLMAALPLGAAVLVAMTVRDPNVMALDVAGLAAASGLVAGWMLRGGAR